MRSTVANHTSFSPVLSIAIFPQNIASRNHSDSFIRYLFSVVDDFFKKQSMALFLNFSQPSPTRQPTPGRKGKFLDRGHSLVFFRFSTIQGFFFFFFLIHHFQCEIKVTENVKRLSTVRILTRQWSPVKVPSCLGSLPCHCYKICVL